MSISIVRIAAAAAVALVLATAAGAQESWTTFRHQAFGFSLTYPNAWEVTRGDGTVAVMVLGPAPAGIASLRLNVNVTIERVPAGMTVDQFEAASESRMGLVFNGYHRLRADRTSVAGRPAIVRYYTWKRNDGLELYQIQLYILADERAYVVTGTTATKSVALQQEVGLLLRIIQTFRP